MYSKDKKIIIDRYNERFKKNGGNIGTLAVGNMERQIVRFNVLSEIGDLEGASVVDVGCGFGDFYGFLLSRGIKVEYTGYDMNPTLINAAREKFPGARFEVLDFFSDKCKEKFDYVVSSSTFNNKLTGGDNYTMIHNVLKRSFTICNEGVSINFLTNYVDYKQGHAFYYGPEKIFKYCKSITNRVALRHDYCLYEFTVYLYKQDCDWKRKERKVAK